MADKGEELVHFITKRVVNYIEMPREERRRARVHRRSKETWLNKWFGVLPMALSMWAGQLKSLRKSRKR